MIYNFTKCESVIAKIMADLDSSESRLRITDIREWIFEAINKIGAPMLYIKRESGVDGAPIFRIEDRQIPLPSDLVHLDGVAYSKFENGPWISMRTQTGLFNLHSKNVKMIEVPNEDLNYAREVPEIQEEQPMLYKYPTSQSLFLTRSNIKHLEHILGNDPGIKPQYQIKPGWIVTNMKDGFIKLSYKSIATDDRGYPLIPDLASYQEAIYWYVTMKLSFPKFLKGKLGGKLKSSNYNIYAYLLQLWNFYRNLAYAEAMMPTADDMLSIKNDWNKLVPDYEADKTFFNGIGDEQLTYNDFYYGY